LKFKWKKLNKQLENAAAPKQNNSRILGGGGDGASPSTAGRKNNPQSTGTNKPSKKRLAYHTNLYSLNFKLSMLTKFLIEQQCTNVKTKRFQTI
jgi:hypothetical protein